MAETPSRIQHSHLKGMFSPCLSYQRGPVCHLRKKFESCFVYSNQYTGVFIPCNPFYLAYLKKLAFGPAVLQSHCDSCGACSANNQLNLSRFCLPRHHNICAKRSKNCIRSVIHAPPPPEFINLDPGATFVLPGF